MALHLKGLLKRNTRKGIRKYTLMFDTAALCQQLCGLCSELKLCETQLLSGLQLTLLKQQVAEMTLGDMILQTSVKSSIFCKMVLTWSLVVFWDVFFELWLWLWKWAKLVETMWTEPLLLFSFAVMVIGATKPHIQAGHQVLNAKTCNFAFCLNDGA